MMQKVVGLREDGAEPGGMSERHWPLLQRKWRALKGFKLRNNLRNASFIITCALFSLPQGVQQVFKNIESTETTSRSTSELLERPKNLGSRLPSYRERRTWETRTGPSQRPTSELGTSPGMDTGLLPPCPTFYRSEHSGLNVRPKVHVLEIQSSVQQC